MWACAEAESTERAERPVPCLEFRSERLPDRDDVALLGGRLANERPVPEGVPVWLEPTVRCDERELRCLLLVAT